jgi:hypothetical protein
MRGLDCLDSWSENSNMPTVHPNMVEGLTIHDTYIAYVSQLKQELHPFPLQSGIFIIFIHHKISTVALSLKNPANSKILPPGLFYKMLTQDWRKIFSNKTCRSLMFSEQAVAFCCLLVKYPLHSMHEQFLVKPYQLNVRHLFPLACPQACHRYSPTKWQILPNCSCASVSSVRRWRYVRKYNCFFIYKVNIT